MTTYAGLLRLDLPSSVIVRLSEGAEIKWGSDIFVPRHATYGGLGGVESLTEGVGSEVPAAQIELLPPSTTAAADLVQPGAQKSLVRAWLAEIDLATMTVSGTPDLLFYGFLDQARLTRGAQSFSLKLSIVSLLEQLFELNIGNSLSPNFHKSVWSGETGEDQATGLVMQDAWGVEAPPSASSYYGGFSGPAWRGYAGGQVSGS